MDVILAVADHLILDGVWAKLVPLPQQTVVAYNGSRSSANWLSTVAESLPASLRPPSINLITQSSTPPVAPSPHSLSAAGTVSAWPRDYIVRQILSVTTLTIIGIVALYLLFAAVSYYFIFDHRMMRHPRFLKNQVKLEIMCSLWSFPGMTLLTLPWFMGEVRGYSRLYSNVEDYGWAYLVLSVPLFVFVLCSNSCSVY
jgi:lathosterol oxidase